MKLIHLKLLTELMRVNGHYTCELQGMLAENLVADTTGEDIPHHGLAFKELSHRYHNKFEKILKEIDFMEEPAEENS